MRKRIFKKCVVCGSLLKTSYGKPFHKRRKTCCHKCSVIYVRLRAKTKKFKEYRKQYYKRYYQKNKEKIRKNQEQYRKKRRKE